MIRYLRNRLRDANLALHWREVELLGRCDCGKCDYWRVRFRNRDLFMSSRTYAAFRWAQSR